MSEITIPALPADLPENFQLQDIIAPNGADIGKPKQHGYNYLMQQMNKTQRAVAALARESGSALENKADLKSPAFTETATLNGKKICTSESIMPTLLNGWIYANSQVAYRLVFSYSGDVVAFGGIITSGLKAVGTRICMLPPKYRPKTDTITFGQIVRRDIESAVNGISIFNTGEVVIDNEAKDLIYLSGAYPIGG